MFPFCDSSSNPPMDLPFYQQLQLSPPSPKPDHQSTTSFLYYPCSPPFADAGLHLLPYHQQQIIDESPEPPLMEPAPAQQQVAAELANAKAAAARKDRHSKICTAGGMRDRRMRLSKDVAHKFFALQDMLGYDKASKTVQWLLNASKSAIQEMMADDADSVEDSSSLSVVDAAKQQQQPLGNGGDQQQHAKPAAAEGNNKKPNKARKTGPKPARKAGNAHPHPVPDKETRAKARERARERTKEKHRMRWVKLASAIDVEAAAACSSVAKDTTNNHLMKNHHHHPEERCSSSTLNNGGGRMQEITGASDVILGFNGGYVAAAGNYYCQQEQQWDLGGVVFQQNNHQRFY